MGLFDGVANWLNGTDDQSGSVNYLPPDDELRFRSWYKKWADKTGLNPNPDDPEQKYDYRDAYKNGIEPYYVEDTNNPGWYWPSKQKAENSDRRFLNERKNGANAWDGTGDAYDTKNDEWVDRGDAHRIAAQQNIGIAPIKRIRPSSLGDIPGGLPGLNSDQSDHGSTLSDFGENVITGLGDSAAGIIDLADLAGKKLLKTKDNLENFIGLATHARGPVSVPPYEEGDEHPLPEDVEGAAQELHGKYEDARDRALERHPNLYGALLTTGADAANQAIQVAATEGISRAGEVAKGGLDLADMVSPKIFQALGGESGSDIGNLLSKFNEESAINDARSEPFNRFLEFKDVSRDEYSSMTPGQRVKLNEEFINNRGRFWSPDGEGPNSVPEYNGQIEIADIAKNLPETKGQGRFFHGRFPRDKEPLEADLGYSNPRSMYSPGGLFTTDSFPMANSYGDDLYEVTPKDPQNPRVFNMNLPLEEQGAMEAIQRALDSSDEVGKRMISSALGERPIRNPGEFFLPSDKAHGEFRPPRTLKELFDSMPDQEIHYQNRYVNEPILRELDKDGWNAYEMKHPTGGELERVYRSGSVDTESIHHGDISPDIFDIPPKNRPSSKELWGALPDEGKSGDNKDLDSIRRYIEENWGKPKGIGDETPNLSASEKKWEEIKNSPDIPTDPYAEAKKTDPESEGYNPFFNDPRADVSSPGSPPPPGYDPNFVASNEYDPPPGGSGGPVIPEDEKGPYTGSTRDLKFNYVGSMNAENYASAVKAKDLNKRFGKQNMDDLSFFLEGTGNPLAPKGEREYAHAFARLNSTQEGREAMQWALHEDLPKNKELYDELDKLGIPLEDYIDNYVKHVWNLDSSDARKFTNTIKSTDAFQKSRSISTLESGINRGMVPRSVNYAELSALRDRSMTRVKATNELLDNMSGLPPVGDLPAMVRQIPREAEDLGGGIGQYHSVNVPALAGILEDAGMPGKGGRVYVLNDYYDTLKPILESTSATKLDQLISTTKALNLSFSLMHPFNIAKRAAQNFGLVRGALEVAKTGGGIPGLYRLMGPAFEATSSAAEKIGLQRISRLLGRPGIDVARDGMLHGLELSAPDLDTMQSSFYKMMDNLERRLPRGLDSIAHGIAATRKTFDTALWPEMVSPLKVAGYQNNLAYLARVQSGKGGVSGGLSRMIQGMYGKPITDMSETEIKRTAALFTNYLYGGQNWRLLDSKFWSDPKTTAVMRRVFISPDWKYSAINTSLAPASSDPAMRALGNRHYIQSAFGIFAAANVMNYMMTMGSQQGPHFMWDNERGKKTQLQTPFTKNDGRGHQRQTYWDIGKLDREAWDFFVGKENEKPIIGSLGRSVLPIWQNIISSATGANLAGFPGHEKQLKEQVKRPLTSAEKVGTNVRQQIDTFLPFNVERAFQDPDQLVNPMTQSMGMSEGKAGDYLYKAYYDQDSKAANEIIQTLGRNGYSSESIDRVVKEAQKKVLKEKYGIKFDGSE